MGRVALSTEQVRVSYEHLPLTLSVTVVNGSMLSFVIADTNTPHRVILIWLGLVLSQAFVRLALWYFYRRSSGGPVWAYVHVCGALVSGMLWGAVPFITMLDEVHLLFVALVIAGMCAGAATVHATYFPATAAFILPAVFPLAISFLLQGGRLHYVAGLMICVFGVALCMASRKFRDVFTANILARFRLNDANRELRAEIQRHRRTEAKLRQAQRLEAVGRLTAGVAHDFNNLLTAIGGAASLVSMRIPANDAYTRQIDIIMDAIDRGSRLTRQLLAFGRRQSLQPVATNINEVVRGMERLLISTVGQHRVKLDLDPRPMQVFIDVAQLEYAILNLVINARDAMPNGGTVTVKTTVVDLDGEHDLTGRYVMLAVSDTGIGMSESVSQQAFDPFFTTKPAGQGSGLGLSQVYGMVQQSGGVTEIDSHLGQGTTIVIYLPAYGALRWREDDH